MILRRAASRASRGAPFPLLKWQQRQGEEREFHEQVRIIHRRTCHRRSSLAAAIGLAVSLALAGLVLLLAGSAQAAGGLQFKTSAGPVAAPLLTTDVEIRVTGHVARATVRQSFRNPHADWYEGIYTFPLPENAAVDQLRMRVGERVVEGEIRERQAAKASYEQAKTEGRRATLVEQERPNIFTTSAANIGPGETIQIEIEYQQTLRYDQGRTAALPDGRRTALRAQRRRGRRAHRARRAAAR